MRATITTLGAILAATLGTAAIEPPQELVGQKLVAPEIVLTGCIVQGSSSAVFIFDNAKKDPKNAVEQGERYLLTLAAEDVLRTHLNHTVRITGEEDFRVSKMPVREPLQSDPKRPADERTMPRLIVKSVTMVLSKCDRTATM